MLRNGAYRTLAFLACAACAADRPVNDARATGIDTLPTLGLVEELRIGSVDDPDYGFSGIGDVEIDAGGEVYVFETDDREIRVYSPDGQLTRRFGRRGNGPGEFSESFVKFLVHARRLPCNLLDSMARRAATVGGGARLARHPMAGPLSDHAVIVLERRWRNRDEARVPEWQRGRR